MYLDDSQFFLSLAPTLVGQPTVSGNVIRAVMPYTVPSEDMLHNLIYLAMCHYNDRRVDMLMEELITYAKTMSS